MGGCGHGDGCPFSIEGGGGVFAGWWGGVVRWAIHLAVRSALKHAVTAVTAINFSTGVSRYNDLFMVQSVLLSRQAMLTY